MFKKFIILLVLVATIGIFPSNAQPGPEVPGGSATTPSSSTFSTEGVNLQTNEMTSGSEVPQGQNGKTFTMKGSGPVKYGDDVFYLENGEQLQILDDG